jgi:hypothetical protein
MNTEQALEVANTVVFTLLGRGLSEAETALLLGSMQNQTYEQIAESSGYAISYLKRDVGPKLWKLLGKALGEAVSKTNFQAALERQIGSSLSCAIPLKAPSVEPSLPSPPSTIGNPHTDWGEAIDVTQFYGRTTELTTLRQWLIQDRCRLVALLGMGGIGKTALAIKLAQQIQSEFEYVIWQSLRNAPPLESLLKELLQFLSSQQETQGEISRLMHYLRTSRCLLIIDNVETILQAGSTGQYRAGYEGYGELFRVIGEVAHSSCLILTSREKPAEIATIEGVQSAVRSYRLSGLQLGAQELLAAKGLLGTDTQKQQLIQAYKGNPLALKIVSTSIQDLFDGDIGKFLEHDIAVFNGIRRLLHQQFECLSYWEKTIMYWLAINREWTSIAELAADIGFAGTKADIFEALEGLNWHSLLEKQSGCYTLQPVVMEYVTEVLIDQVTRELATKELSLFISHALIKTTVKEYVRESQVRLILQPIADRFYTAFSSPLALKHQIKEILELLRDSANSLSCYGGGNLINLCVQLQIHLKDYDFSNLKIAHAYLQKVNLYQVNFSHCNLDKSVFTQTLKSVVSVAFSPDGTLLATGDTSPEVRLWQVADGQAFLLLQGHTNLVSSVAWSPDGQTLATSSHDQTVKLWDTHTGQCLKTLHGHSSWVSSVAWSPDGQTLATSSHDQTAKLWDTHTGQCLKTLHGHTSSVMSVAWSPDGQTLATSSHDQTVKLWVRFVQSK